MVYTPGSWLFCDHTHLIFDVDGPQHLEQVFLSVFQKLLNLQNGLQLVELLYLFKGIRNEIILKYSCIHIIGVVPYLIHGLYQVMDLATSSS